jgi:PST family polysaccharide transporter
MGPLAVRLLYAKGFEPTAPLLEWFIWAILCFLVGWPLGLWVMARRAKRLVAFSQLVLGLSGLVFGLFLVPAFGVRGAAIAYFGNAAAYAVTLLLLLRRDAGRWISSKTAALIVVSAAWLAVAKMAVLEAGSVYWGAIPTAVSAIVCASLYFRATGRSDAEEDAR